MGAFEHVCMRGRALGRLCDVVSYYLIASFCLSTEFSVEAGRGFTSWTLRSCLHLDLIN